MSDDCRALIVYKGPSILTFAESLITDEALRRGDRARASEIAWLAIARSFGIPSKIANAGDCNYSSAKLDQRLKAKGFSKS